MSLATLKTLREAASAAELAGDAATALAHYHAIQALLVAMPDLVQGGDEIAFDRKAVEGAIARLRRDTAAAGGIGQTKVQYATTTD